MRAVSLIFLLFALSTLSAQDKVDKKVVDRVGNIADADLEKALSAYHDMVRGQCIASVVSAAQADMAYLTKSLAERKLDKAQEKTILRLLQNVKSSADHELFLYKDFVAEFEKEYAKKGAKALKEFQEHLKSVNATFENAFHERVLESRRLGWKVPPPKD